MTFFWNCLLQETEWQPCKKQRTISKQLGILYCIGLDEGEEGKDHAQIIDVEAKNDSKQLDYR